MPTQERRLPSHREEKGGREDEAGDPHPHEQRCAERPPRLEQGLDEGPLEENARADATASTRPDVLTRRTGSALITGRDAVGAAMAESGCHRCCQE